MINVHPIDALFAIEISETEFKGLTLIMVEADA